MEEFIHLYEMESLSLGITARRDVLEQIRGFFTGGIHVARGFDRTAEALAARRQEAKAREQHDTEDHKDPGDPDENGSTRRLVIAGNSKVGFRQRLRNIQLVALSNALVKSRAIALGALDLAHNHLGEVQPDGGHDALTKDSSSSSLGSGPGRGDDEEPVLDETPYLLDAIPAIVRLLQPTALYSSVLEEIDLSGNRLGPESCRLLCAALVNEGDGDGAPVLPLRRLNLQGNPLGLVGGHAIAELLGTRRCGLEELHLGSTELEVENLVAIATALRDNTRLHAINLDNPIVRTKEEEAIQHLGKMLQVNTTLRTMSLSKHQLTDHGAQVLAERLLDNQTLQCLILRANRIGATGATALAALLLRHDALAELDLSANRLGDLGAEAFAKVLRHNTRPLTTLSLSSTYLTDDGLVALAEACLSPRHPERNHLRNLFLWGNDFGERSARLFLELHRGRFADLDIETDFLPIPSDDDANEGEEGGGGRVQIAHRETQRAQPFASPKR